MKTIILNRRSVFELEGIRLRQGANSVSADEHKKLIQHPLVKQLFESGVLAEGETSPKAAAKPGTKAAAKSGPKAAEKPADETDSGDVVQIVS